MTRTLTAAHDGDGVTITVDGTTCRWRTGAAGGQADPGLLADRPAEERARPTWSVRWAVPVTFGGQDGDAPAGRLPEGVGAVVHAPTLTDEPLGLPALLLASFPLSPDRRHVAPGPLTNFLLDQAAEAFARLLPARWPRALELLAAPSLRAVLVEPTRVLLADGRHADVPSYTAWWLRRHPVLSGHRPSDKRAVGTDPLLAGLYDEAAL